jgi:hypothetical protein
MVEKFTMNIDDILEFDYQVEEISDNVITVNKDAGGISESYYSTDTYVFDPQSIGTYELDINGQIIEIEVTDIPDSEVDYFEDSGLSEYDGDTGSFSVTDGSSDGLTTPQEGDQMLREYISSGSATIYSTSGLPNYPSAGNKFRCWVYFGAQSGYASSGELIRTHFGVQSSASSSYAIVLSPKGDSVEIWKDGSAIASTNASINGVTWYDQRCEWKSDKINVDVLDVNGNTIASVSVTDSTYSSGGVGFGHNAGGNSGYWDGFATE